MEQLTTPLPLGRPIRRRVGRRLLGVAAIVLVGLGLVMHKTVRQYKVTSGSMEPTLQVDQRVAAEPAGGVRVGDIVVFHPPTGARAKDPVCGSGLQGSRSTQPCDAAVPQESGAVFVKRVVAGPGDLIAIVDGHVVRNGVRESEPFVAPCGPGAACSFPTAVRVPPDEYYLLGDNRGVSDDSRFWGPVPSGWILGTVVQCSLLDTVCHAVR
ncbi:MAG TPA: signal peptidase I [Solirubrobacteraceae bacterium]|nr:signal peptidase I [Solirubrobacteraceae bacterium]